MGHGCLTGALNSVLCAPAGSSVPRQRSFRFPPRLDTNNTRLTPQPSTGPAPNHGHPAAAAANHRPPRATPGHASPPLSFPPEISADVGMIVLLYSMESLEEAGAGGTSRRLSTRVITLQDVLASWLTDT